MVRQNLKRSKNRTGYTDFTQLSSRLFPQGSNGALAVLLLPSKTRGPGRGKSLELFMYDILFYLISIFAPLPGGT